MLERGFTPMMWIGLVPLAFTLAGLAGITTTIRKQQLQPSSPVSPNFTGLPAGVDPALPGTGAIPSTLELRPGTSPLGKLLGTLLAALFWNGIVSVFCFQAFKGWRQGHVEWFLAVFLIPFLLIGLGLIAAVFYFLLALFNPRPRLVISPGMVRLGETLRIDWEVRGRVEVLRNLRVRLQGREAATHRQGKNTTTDRSTFVDLELAKVITTQEMRSGSCVASIPGHSMHSFSSQNNKLLWTIWVQGEIERWPDVNEEFPITVLPAARCSKPAYD